MYYNINVTTLFGQRQRHTSPAVEVTPALSRNVQWACETTIFPLCPSTSNGETVQSG
jgi:hypothetical protein